jgi:hypothetical protein
VANLVILIKGGIFKIWKETLLLLLLGIDKYIDMQKTLKLRSKKKTFR